MTISGVSGTTTSTPTTTSAGNQTLGKDDFLKLLITQLKNQDPLNPLDQNQFLAQTAQFTSLENLQNISTQLTDIKSLTAGSSFAQSAALIGKTVRTSGRDFTLNSDGAVLPFTLDRAAAVNLDILDSSGIVVRHVTSNSLDAGTQAVSWDGRDSARPFTAPEPVSPPPAPPRAVRVPVPAPATSMHAGLDVWA